LRSIAHMQQCVSMNASPSPIITAVEAVPQLVQILSGMASAERQKALSATMILLGDSFLDHHRKAVEASPTPELPSAEGISPKAAAWMLRNSLTMEQLEHVFSIDGGSVDVIAAKLPGDSKRQQTVQAYLLSGLSSYLKTGEPSFLDKDARDLCQKIGCYDSPNHSNSMKALGNFVHGSKDGGWKLTAPGLSETVKIIKLLTPSTND
jgi:hypothetical protein